MADPMAAYLKGLAAEAIGEGLPCGPDECERMVGFAAETTDEASVGPSLFRHGHHAVFFPPRF